MTEKRNPKKQQGYKRFVNEIGGSRGGKYSGARKADASERRGTGSAVLAVAFQEKNGRIKKAGEFGGVERTNRRQERWGRTFTNHRPLTEGKSG